MAIRRVGSVTISHWRRVSCAAANMLASVAALASSACQIRASCSVPAGGLVVLGGAQFVFGADGVHVRVAFGDAHEA